MTAAFSPTLVSTPHPTSRSGRATAPLAASGISGGAVGGRRSGIGWVGDSIGYIYVYLRGKLDAEERRRRLTEERAGAEALLSGAINELASAVLREGVSHPDFTGLLEAIGRAHAKREAAAADMIAADSLQQAEASRLGGQESTAEAEWSSADRAGREAEEILRAATSDRRTAETRLARVKDERARLDREAAGGSPIGAARSGQIVHETAGLASEQRALDERLAGLDRELTDLRAKAAALRTATAAAKSKLEMVVAARRQAASAMAASIAGRERDRGDAEREVADLTAQLGRVTADIRPPHTALLSAYQNIDRLTETISDRGAQLAALEQARGHYDQRKLLTGVGLLTSMLIVTAAALWAVLR